MSDKEFPSCAYDVCAEFDCEETMALALIATRNELDRTRKALDVAVSALKLYSDKPGNWLYGEFQGDYDENPGEKATAALEQITALEQKD